jgi:hypothetical protein
VDGTGGVGTGASQALADRGAVDGVGAVVSGVEDVELSGGGGGDSAGEVE